MLDQKRFDGVHSVADAVEYLHSGKSVGKVCRMLTLLCSSSFYLCFFLFKGHDHKMAQFFTTYILQVVVCIDPSFSEQKSKL